MKAKDKLKREEISYFNSHAESYDHGYCYGAMRIKYEHDNFLKWLSRLNRNAIILEISGGTGKDSIEIVKRGFTNVIMSDIAPKMVNLSRKKAREENLDNLMNFCVIDGERLPFANEVFDSVMLVAAMHHMVNPQACLRQIYRCLKPGAYLILGLEPARWPEYLRLLYSTIGVKLLRAFNKSYVQSKPSPAEKNTKGFKKRYLRKILLESGFTILEFNNLSYIGGFLNVAQLKMPRLIDEVIIQIDKVLSKVPLIKEISWNFSILCIKREK